MADLSQNIEAITRYLLPDLLWDDITKSDDPLFKRIKVNGSNYDKIQYDQWNNSWGITSYRGLGAQPPVIQYPNFQRYEMDPGYWGEKLRLDESTITRSREPGTIADPINIEDYTTVMNLHLQSRLVSMIRYALCTTIRTGLYSQTAPTPAAAARFTYQIQNYASQQFTPAVPWKAAASLATPITDMIGYQAQLQKGTSNRFGGDGVLLGNSFSIQDFFNTTQIQSTYKNRYGASIIGLDGANDSEGLNKIMNGFGLSPIMRYDEGYYNTMAAAAAKDKTQFTYAIPNQCLLWLGTRDQGQQIFGEFQLTRHAGLIETSAAKGYPNADGVLEKWTGPTAIQNGLYVRAHYQNSMPHGYDIELGLNGSPLIGYPGCLAVITWT